MPGMRAVSRLAGKPGPGGGGRMRLAGKPGPGGKELDRGLRATDLGPGSTTACGRPWPAFSVTDAMPLIGSRPGAPGARAPWSGAKLRHRGAGGCGLLQCFNPAAARGRRRARRRRDRCGRDDDLGETPGGPPRAVQRFHMRYAPASSAAVPITPVMQAESHSEPHPSSLAA
jgi:hypothetical protein